MRVRAFACVRPWVGVCVCVCVFILWSFGLLLQASSSFVLLFAASALAQCAQRVSSEVEAALFDDRSNTWIPVAQMIGANATLPHHLSMAIAFLV